MTSSQQGSLSRLLVPGFRSFLAFLSRCRLWNYAITFVPLDSRPSSPIWEAIKIKSFFTLGEWILANICATLQKNVCVCKLSQNLDWVTFLTEPFPRTGADSRCTSVDIRIALCSFCSRSPLLFHLGIFRLTKQSQTDLGSVSLSLQLNTFCTQLRKHRQVFNSTSM